MSASASGTQSATDSHNIQASTQGASGAKSPTITAGGAVTFHNVENDPTLQLETVKTLGDVVTAALKGSLGAVNVAQGDVAAQAAQQATNDTNLLGAVLSAQSQLATAQGTGGASLSYNTNNYLIWGMVAVAIVFIFSIGKRRTA